MSGINATRALVALRQSGSIVENEARDRLEVWAAAELDRDVEAGQTALHALWSGALDAGATAALPLWQLASGHPSRAITAALELILAERPNMPLDPLRMLLMDAAKRLPPNRLAELADAALGRTDLSPRARTLWSLVVFGVRGDPARAALDGHDAQDLHALMDDSLGAGVLEHLPVENEAERASRDAAIIRALGPTSTPETASASTGRTVRGKRSSDAVHRAIRQIERNTDPSVTTLLDECLEMAVLADWHPQLRHAREVQARSAVDNTFEHPSIGQVLALLTGGAPVNAADLRAILVDELRRLARNLRADHESPWLDYWNTDAAAKPVDPKVENAVRNTTLTKLRDALGKYRIAVTLAEVQRKDGTRVDLYTATHNGRNLPTEAKRHYHPDLWTAAKEQLQEYTTSEGATGDGILLVFWFGDDWTGTPARLDKIKPKSAGELEALLISDLSPELRKTTDVVILDVSRPGGGQSKSSFDKRAKRLRALEKADDAVKEASAVGEAGASATPAAATERKKTTRQRGTKKTAAHGPE